jgi:hypothetical protein
MSGLSPLVSATLVSSEALAGGSMFAFELPGVIAAAGTPGGPPLPENFTNSRTFLK